MAGSVVGSAEFVLQVNQQGLVTGIRQGEATARDGSAKIQQAIDGNLKKAEQSAQRFGSNFQKALQIGGAITGVALGLETVSRGLEKVVEQTQKAAQAQFALNKVYGDAATQYKAFAQAQAQLTGRTSTDFEQASVKAATLAKNYGLTAEQIQTLITRSADLAAVHGKELPDAAERVIAAIRGEAEAAEALGLTLNSDAVRAFANMTDEQRRNFETLDQVTKAQIIYRELLRQTNDVQGAAVERANSQLGAFDKLEASTSNLAKAIGEALVPGLGELSGGFAVAIDGAAGLIEQFNKLQRLGSGSGLARIGAIIQAATGNPGPLIGQLIGGSFAPEAPAVDSFPTLPGGLAGPVLTDEGRAAITQRRAEEKRRAKEILDDRKEAVEQRAELEIRGLQKEIQAAERAHQAKRVQAEKARDAEIKAAEDTRDGQIKAIEQQAQASADRYERQIRDAEAARDKERQDSEDRRDGSLKALAEVEQAARDANDAQIRDQEILRDKEKQAAEDRRDGTIRLLDEEKRARENARRQEDRDLEDQTQDILRDLEARTKAAEAGFERQAKKAEQAHERDIRGIERAAQKEDDRHRKVMDGLDNEQDARLAVLDAQLKALDVADRQVDAAERLADLTRKAADAQTALKKATGTGTPEEIAAAREELTRAIRGGDQISVENARERLSQLAGQGAAAVKKAQEDLAEATSDIQKEQTKEARDAERERLQDAKDTIKQEIDARKDAENERNRQRERELQADRKASDDKYRSAKEKIDQQSRDEKEAYTEAVRRERDLVEQAKRAIEDRRRAEDQADQDKRREATDTYELEQRQIKATYDDEETGVIPALRRAREAADREFKAKRETITAAYEEEQRQLKETYDGPEGVLQRLRDQAEAARREYGARKDAVNEAYHAEKDRIKEVYDDPEYGILAKLDAAKQKTIDSLNAQVEKWRTWKTDTVKEIGEALAKLEEFLTKVGALDKIGTVTVNGDPVTQNAGGRQGGPGGDLAYGPVVRNASPDSYWTSGGTHGGHPAADIFAPAGSPVYAPVGGSIYTGSDGKGGNWAVQRGDDGRSYYFAHGNVPFASGRVEAGQQIGQVGNTGNASSTSPHLHFAIASRSDLFGELGGSGDIDGDSSYWGAGGTARGGGDDEIEISLFGRKFKVRTSGGNIPGDVGKWISEAIKLAGVPSSWATPLAEIAAAESGQRNADGSVVIGTGSATAGNLELVGGESATGLMQTLPSTFRAYAVPGYTDIYNPIHNAAAAARYIKERYGSPRNTLYYQNGAFDWRGVPGYRDGTTIKEPTLLYGLNRGLYGVAGEAGPERLMGVDETRAERSGGSASPRVFNVNGVGVNEFMQRIRHAERREDLLTGVR